MLGQLLPYVLGDLKWPDPHEVDFKSTFLQKIQMLILQFFKWGEEASRDNRGGAVPNFRGVKPQPKPAPPDQIERFCKAIQAHETGGNPNSLPSGFNNP